MKKNLVAHATAVIALLCALPASAGVIYRWQDVTPNPNIGAFAGYIEFSYDYWSPDGHLSVSGASSHPDAGLEPLFGIESFFWSNPSGIGFRSSIDAFGRPCSVWQVAGGCESIGLSDADLVLTPRHLGEGFGGAVEVTFGPILSGSLFLGDATTDVEMQSLGALWTITRTGSDGPGVCHSNDGRCWGSTGLWVLDLSTLPSVHVIEPSTAALMLLAIVALLACRVRRRGLRVEVRHFAQGGALLAAVICSTPASAGVIYRWQDVTPNPHIGSFLGEIEFSYDVWSPGGHISESGGTSGNLDPIFGVQRFLWSNPSGIGYAEEIESTERPCSAFVEQGLPYDCTALGLPDDVLVLFPLTGGGPIAANFQLTFGALLEGILSFNDSSTDVYMQSAGPLWTIQRTGSDGKTGICFRNDGSCWGSTGVWVLDLSTLPPVKVSEPATATLWLLAIAFWFGCPTRHRGPNLSRPARAELAGRQRTMPGNPMQRRQRLLRRGWICLRPPPYVG